MERKIKNLIAAVVVAAGLGVSLIPLTSYAEDPAYNKRAANTGAVSLKVNSTLTLEIGFPTPGADDPWTGSIDTSGSTPVNSLEINVAPGMMSVGKFYATVSSSSQYTLSVNGYNPTTPADATKLVATDAGNTDEILGTSCSVEAATKSNCWNVKVEKTEKVTPTDPAELGTTQNGFNSFRAIPATATAAYQSTSTSGTRDETTTFNVGVSASSSLHSGNYSGALLVTAANV